MRRMTQTSAVLAVTAVALAFSSPPSQAIVGGNEVGDGNLTFIAQMENTAVGGICTGTLISNQWVLTAAHCSVPATIADVRVRVGNSKRSSGGHVRRIQRIVNNPSYRGGHDDVSLWQLNEPITSIAPARLGNANEAVAWDGIAPGGIVGADTGLAVGWGQIADPGALPKYLQYTYVTIGRTVGDGLNIPMIPVSKGPCYGDSGGPLLVSINNQYVVAGTLKGANCVDSGSYSRVSEGGNRTFINQTLTTNVSTPFGAVDYDNDGHQDIVERNNATGDLWLYPGQSVRGYSSTQPVKIGNGWMGTTPFGLVDWDRDGYQDIIERNDTTNDLWLYPGQGRRGYSGFAPVKLASGLRDYSPMGVGDWDRDGRADLILRDNYSGALEIRFCDGLRQAMVCDTRTLATGYGATTSFGVTDWNLDGRLDLLARNNDSNVVTVNAGKGTRDTGFTSSSTLITNFAGRTVYATADWDRDGYKDLVVRTDANGDLWLYRGQSGGGLAAAPIKVGNGW